MVWKWFPLEFKSIVWVSESVSCSVVSDSVISWIVAHQAPLCMGLILQARKLKCITIPFSRGSFQPKDWTQVLLNCRQILYHLSHREVLVKHSEEGLWALRKDSGHLGSFPRVCWINPKPVVFLLMGVTCVIIEKWDSAKKQKEELENPVKTTVNILVYMFPGLWIYPLKWDHTAHSGCHLAIFTHTFSSK